MTSPPLVTDIEYVGSWGEMRHRGGEKIYQFRPLVDSYSLCVAIKNVGTAKIDHFQWQQTSSLAHMNMELLRPKIPSNLWRPFAGNMVTATFRRQVVLRGGEAEVVNPDISQAVEVAAVTPCPDGGIRPGEVFSFVERQRPYIEYLREGMQARALDIGAKLEMEVADAERGLLDIIITTFKVGPVSLHDMKMQVELKGKLGALQEVLIDGNTYVSKETELVFL